MEHLTDRNIWMVEEARWWWNTQNGFPKAQVDLSIFPLSVSLVGKVFSWSPSNTAHFAFLLCLAHPFPSIEKWAPLSCVPICPFYSSRQQKTTFKKKTFQKIVGEVVWEIKANIYKRLWQFVESSQSGTATNRKKIWGSTNEANFIRNQISPWKVMPDETLLSSAFSVNSSAIY